MYVPYTLPPLPRLRCPFEIITSEWRKGEEHIVARPCNERAQNHGWCRDHAYVQEILELAGRLGYPALQVNPHYLMAGGHANWEGDCERLPPGRAVIVKGLLIELHEARIRDEANKD